MRRFSAALATLLLAACGQQEQAADQAGPNQAPAAERPARSGTGATASPQVGTGLTGATTGLVGTVTGFAVRDTGMARVIDIQADTLFAFDKADLDSGAEANLARAAQLIASAPSDRPIAVVGHSDARGEDAYNLALSERRAQAVVAWLQARPELSAYRFTAEGKGETEPKVSADENAPDSARAPNRRVEIIVPK